MPYLELYISPINAVKEDIAEDIDYILCTYDAQSLNLEPVDNVLILEFHDTVEAGPLSFNKELAERIKSFINRKNSNFDCFVCCDAGESRSSAITAAILKSEGASNLYIWESTDYHPNTLVYLILCEVLGCPVSESEVASLKKKNDWAFHKARIMPKYEEARRLWTGEGGKVDVAESLKICEEMSAAGENMFLYLQAWIYYYRASDDPEYGTKAADAFERFVSAGESVSEWEIEDAAGWLMNYYWSPALGNDVDRALHWRREYLRMREESGFHDFRMNDYIA